MPLGRERSHRNLQSTYAEYPRNSPPRTRSEARQILTVSFCLLNTGMATVVISTRPWSSASCGREGRRLLGVPWTPPCRGLLLAFIPLAKGYWERALGTLWRGRERTISLPALQADSPKPQLEPTCQSLQLICSCSTIFYQMNLIWISVVCFITTWQLHCLTPQAFLGPVCVLMTLPICGIRNSRHQWLHKVSLGGGETEPRSSHSPQGRQVTQTPSPLQIPEC